MTDARPPATIDLAGLDELLSRLGSDGRTLIGPVLRQEAIVFDVIRAVADLPRGVIEEQEAGTYRLRRTSDVALFGFSVGPTSLKTFLHPSRLTIVRAEKSDGELTFRTPRAERPRYAVIGARSCDIHSVLVMDRVFLKGPFVDPHYQLRREDLFVVAVNCGRSGGTCFCASLGTGPRAETGFDLALTELASAGDHRFVVEVGSADGGQLLDQVTHRAATTDELDRARCSSQEAAASQSRSLDSAAARELLVEHPEHPRWKKVAERCLSCANCTMVCPTCFCTGVRDTSDLEGNAAERIREWDSCFTAEHSYVHGGEVRRSVRSRYRQWLTHKVSTWWEQFGTSGCVGCGRCITWCPVGIDLVEEVAAIAAAPAKPEKAR